MTWGSSTSFVSTGQRTAERQGRDLESRIVGHLLPDSTVHDVRNQRLSRHARMQIAELTRPSNSHSASFGLLTSRSERGSRVAPWHHACAASVPDIAQGAERNRARDLLVRNSSHQTPKTSRTALVPDRDMRSQNRAMATARIGM